MHQSNRKVLTFDYIKMYTSKQSRQAKKQKESGQPSTDEDRKANPRRPSLARAPPKSRLKYSRRGRGRIKHR